MNYHLFELLNRPAGRFDSLDDVMEFLAARLIALFLHRGWGIVLGVAALAIGIARIWVGVHYPGDIIAGAVVAGLAALEVYVWTRWRHDPARSGDDLSRMRGLW